VKEHVVILTTPIECVVLIDVVVNIVLGVAMVGVCAKVPIHYGTDKKANDD
jgi:hypothetical protein